MSRNILPSVSKKSRSIIAFEAAFFSLLEQYSCDKISVTDIHQKAGYSRTAFYANYVDKNDFIDKTMVSEVATQVNIIYNAIKDNAGNLFDGTFYLPALSLFHHVYDHRSLYQALCAGKITGWDNSRFSQLCHEYYLQIIRVPIPPNPKLDLTFRSYIETYRFNNYISFWAMMDFCYTPEYMAEQVALQLKIDYSGLTDTIHTLDATL